MVCAGETLDVADLPQYMRDGATQRTDVITFPSRPSEPGPPAGGLSFDEQERRVVEQALERSGGNQVHAARLLNISRDKLRYKIKKHNLR